MLAPTIGAPFWSTTVPRNGTCCAGTIASLPISDTEALTVLPNNVSVHAIKINRILFMKV